MTKAKRVCPIKGSGGEGGTSAEGCVRFDQAQDLPESQKAQARENIGAGSGTDCFTVIDGKLNLKYQR